MPGINDYVPIVGANVIDELKLLGSLLKGKTVQNINSTSVGGGVAEILNRMIPLMNELGVDARWDLIKGGEKFFNITKKFHNALHGAKTDITSEELEHFKEVNRQNAASIFFNGDIVFVHDPQPIALIEKKNQIGKKWIWRCHIDFSNPDEKLWSFLKGYVENYDVSVFSAPAFARQLSIRQVLLSPSIDPLSDKNKELDENYITSVFERFEIDRSRPVITQISRFDYLKDPVGVIESYKNVKKYVDCQLVLAGGGATDDPEGEKVLSEVREKASGDKDIFILLLPPSSDLEINALQRGSDIILQKSLREGFGLTVAEALWKKKPVIAGAVGGIPLQITHKYSGMLTRTVEGTSYWIKQILNSPEYGKKLGINGYEHIKNNYLLTRHLREYFLMFLSLFNEGDIIHF